MEEAETVPILSRKELRKQKLMEYLATKGKLKEPNPKPYLRDNCQVKKTLTSAQKVVTGKENRAPADRLSCNHTKVPTLVAQSTILPSQKVFFSNKKLSVKSSILTGRQNTNRPSATSHQAQQKLNPKPVPTRMMTIMSSNSKLNEATHLKKQLSTRMHSSGRASSSLTLPAGTKSNNRFSSSSNVARSSPMKRVTFRISLGPLVKTKTGLIPAVTQPKISHSLNLTHTSATAADTATTASSFPNMVRSSTLSSISKWSANAQRKSLPTPALNNPVNERTNVSTTAITKNKVQDQDKSNSRPLLGKASQQSCKNRLSSGLKSMSSTSKCTAAPIKPEGKVGITHSNKSAGQLAYRSTKQRSNSEGDKNGQQCRVASQTSSGPVSRCSSRAASRVRQPVVPELGWKTKTSKETDIKKGHSLASAQPQPSTKRTGPPVMSQTVPWPARTVSHTGKATDKKIPKVPVSVISHTEGKKLTAVQEERMRKLQEWRDAKGISYKRPPMPVKPQVKRIVAVPQPFWATMKEEDEAHSLICAVDRSLADCIKLLEEGCPPDQVEEVLSRLPAVSKKFAKYWICKVRLMEQQGKLDVLPMFEEAVGVVLEPVDELRTVVFEILKKKDEIKASEENEKEEVLNPVEERTPESINNPMMTPKPVRALICGEKGDSSVVKYKITATPGGPPSHQKKPAQVNGQEVRFFTPVRRSVRIERASLRYPASLQDHDLCVASYNDLISEEDNEGSEEQKGGENSPSADNTLMYVYRQNEALKDKVFLQLVYDESV